MAADATLNGLRPDLRLIANQDDDPAFIRAVTTPKRGVGQSTLEALGAFAGQWQCSLFEAVFKGGIEAKLADRQLHPLRGAVRKHGSLIQLSGNSRSPAARSSRIGHSGRSSP